MNPTEWTANAIVLITEHRHCGCGRTHICPNHRPQLELQRTSATGKLEVRYDPLPPSGSLQRGIARRIVEVHSESETCHECFREQADSRHLFPENILSGRVAADEFTLDRFAFAISHATPN